MDFSSGLGLTFGTNNEDQDFDHGDFGESEESNNQDETMEEGGELEQTSTSFQNQDDDPDATPRPKSSNQFFPNDFQSSSQPYRQAQPSAPFHLSGDGGEFQAINQSNNFGQGIPQGLQFGGDPQFNGSQFNGNGYPPSGFQNMLNQPGSDNWNVFGNSGMHSQQHMHNNQHHMFAQGMQQFGHKGESHNTHQMNNYPSFNSSQTFGGSAMNDPENQLTPRMSDQHHFGSSMSDQFQMNNQFQPMSSAQNQNGQSSRSNFPFKSANSAQDNHNRRNNHSIRPRPSHHLNAPSHPHALPAQVHLKMRAMGLNPHNPAEVEIYRDHLMISRQGGHHTQMRADGQQAEGSRVSSSSTIIHHSMDANEPMHQGMGQGRAWANQYGQGHTGNPFHPPGNSASGPQMNNHDFQHAIPPVPPNQILRSDNTQGEPVFGDHPLDWQYRNNGPFQPDPRPYIALGSAQIMSASDNLTNQQFRRQLRPPKVGEMNSGQMSGGPMSGDQMSGGPMSGGQNQQGQSQFNYPQPRQSDGNPQFNQFGQSQNFHQNGLPPEYIPPHGHHFNNFADNGVESAEPIEEDEEEQQEEGNEPESQAEEEEQEEEEEVDSDGFSLHSDDISSPPPNIYPIPRPLGMPPSPTPRFPSNEVNPNNAPNKPPPIIGTGNIVWSNMPGAFNAAGHITDWDKAKRRTVMAGNRMECSCAGVLHRDGSGFYMNADESVIWCNAGEMEKIEEEKDEEDENVEESEEDEELKGVPKWVKQVLTHGPSIDKEEVRKEEAAYRAMMAEQVKKILARKAAKERGEEIPEKSAVEQDFGQMNFDTFFNDAKYRGEGDNSQMEPELKDKGKRKARAGDSDDDSEVESPTKKWKGKGKAVDSDEELDEEQLARKYMNKAKAKGKGKAKGKVFELPEGNEIKDLLFGEYDTTTGLGEEVGLQNHTHGEETDNDDNGSISGGASTTQEPDKMQFETESTIADSDLAATGIILPPSFPLPQNDHDEEDVEEVPIQAPYQSRRNEGPFNLFQSLLLTPEVILELVRQLSPKQLLALYSISRPFNDILSGWMAHSIKNIVKYQAPFSYKIYPFVLYGEISMLDPVGRLNKSGKIRRVPGLKYHQMVLHRVRAVRDILAALARQHLRCPPGTHKSLKKVWFLMDISTTLDRVRLIHNREFFTDEDLYNIQHFIVKLDMRFNDPMDGPGSDMLRKLMLGQRGLSPLYRLLTRTGFTDLYELQSYIVRYTYAPIKVADDIGEGMFGVPFEEIGRGHLEGWGKGEKHLMRIDELVMREATRRELGFKEHISMMLLWGFVDPLTGENLSPSEQECYMSDGEGEEVEAEGDPWEGTGMNMARLEALVLGKEESDGEDGEDAVDESGNGDGDDGDDEDENENEDRDADMDVNRTGWAHSINAENSRQLWS